MSALVGPAFLQAALSADGCLSSDPAPASEQDAAAVVALRRPAPEGATASLVVALAAAWGSYPGPPAEQDSCQAERTRICWPQFPAARKEKFATSPVASPLGCRHPPIALRPPPDVAKRSSANGQDRPTYRQIVEVQARHPASRNTSRNFRVPKDIRSQTPATSYLSLIRCEVGLRLSPTHLPIQKVEKISARISSVVVSPVSSSSERSAR